jgi:archaellum component FlaC
MREAMQEEGQSESCEDAHTWSGPDRRASSKACEKLEALEHRVDKCKQTFELDIGRIQESVTSVKIEVHGLRADVHKMTESIGSINTSLETIANTMTKMTDFPDTWAKIQGFWAVMRWVRDNFIPIAAVLGAIGYGVNALGKSMGVTI